MASRTDVARRIYLPPWRVDATVRPGVRPPVPLGRLARLVGAALEAGGAPRPASIGLTLSDDAELAELNVRHMGADGPTDVLSFPLLPPEAFPPHPGGPTVAELEVGEAGARAASAAFALPPGVRPNLGDIVVSVERATAQAEAGQGGQTSDVRWSAADELALLVVHGALHVCGWDHAEPLERAAMRALERDVLAGFGPVPPSVEP